MAGIYIHIPFCKTICSYCDFYSRTNLIFIDDFINSLINEINLRKDYLGDSVIKTIYFGGGTPSIVVPEKISKIYRKLSDVFKFSGEVEVTLEANPDDITKDYLYKLKDTAVNRISLGVQSFIEKELKLLNRRHNANTNLVAINDLLKAGFNNLSCDLIYGIPGSNVNSLDFNLKQLYEFELKHISAYHLSYEKNTPIDKLLRSKKIVRVKEQKSNLLFKYLIKSLLNNGFRQYEISNFAKRGYISRHNSNYWKNIKYIGFGPAAHSYDLKSRQWNISSIRKYITTLNQNLVPSKYEVLSDDIAFNEFVMTRLRTRWGIETEQVLKYFGYGKVEYLQAKLKDFTSRKIVMEKEGRYKLTFKGMLIADQIIKDLFI